MLRDGVDVRSLAATAKSKGQDQNYSSRQGWNIFYLRIASIDYSVAEISLLVAVSQCAYLSFARIQGSPPRETAVAASGNLIDFLLRGTGT